MYKLRKTTAMLMALAMLFACIPTVFAGTDTAEPAEVQYLESGQPNVPKLSKAEITELLEANPTDTPTETSDVFDEEPSCTAPYSAGKMTDTLLQRGLSRLNALRTIAGIDPVALDADLCESAQFGAVLLAASNFSHYPDQPEDMDDDFYQLGYAATSSSNIYGGVYFLTTMDGFINDSDASNVDRLGHRRWELNPTMGKVGFGYAYNASSTYRYYTCEKVFDRSHTAVEYEFISWPPSGNFPNNTYSFANNTAWSVTLNPDLYQTPDITDITVTLTRETDGYEWVLGGTEEYTAAASGRYLNVNAQWYGVPLCIIFRPDEVESYAGVYTVRIDGLKNKSGAAVDFAYRVDFFDASPLTSAPDDALNYTPGALTFQTNAAYPFYYTETDGRTVGVSGNAGVSNSQSFVQLTQDFAVGDVISFDYYYYPRNSYDSFVFSMDGITLLQPDSTAGEWASFSYTIEYAGQKTFKWTYAKRYAFGSGEDKLMLDNIRITHPVTLLGDADGNGVLSFADVAALYGIIFGGDVSPELAAVCDVNGDGSISFADVAALYGIVLGS